MYVLPSQGGQDSRPETAYPQEGQLASLTHVWCLRIWIWEGSYHPDKSSSLRLNCITMWFIFLKIMLVKEFVHFL